MSFAIVIKTSGPLMVSNADRAVNAIGSVFPRGSGYFLPREARSPSGLASSLAAHGGDRRNWG